MFRRFPGRAMMGYHDGFGMESHVEEIKQIERPIDRERTCPLLLRLFYQIGRHHAPHEYTQGKTPLNELQIYTWLDASLKELTSLITDVNPDARRRGTHFDFKLVCPGPNGYRLVDVGNTCTGMRNPDDSRTLAQINFVIGDYMDICITPPNRVIRGGRQRQY
ncbi:unnamed protein product [Notodromas monacha]|uniref:18 kDa Sin3-associated polypeptide n=1 Tax=Notodromas monacha TaxID=399045 RepID=A0A7R9GDM8_9CRUS|nr:unnamed protein product [Notodromas monacha]CAG0917060.1 unnamed protein product [Notodromas monacha]